MGEETPGQELPELPLLVPGEIAMECLEMTDWRKGNSRTGQGASIGLLRTRARLV